MTGEEKQQAWKRPVCSILLRFFTEYHLKQLTLKIEPRISHFFYFNTFRR